MIARSLMADDRVADPAAGHDDAAERGRQEDQPERLVRAWARPGCPRRSLPMLPVVAWRGEMRPVITTCPTSSGEAAITIQVRARRWPCRGARTPRVAGRLAQLALEPDPRRHRRQAIAADVLEGHVGRSPAGPDRVGDRDGRQEDQAEDDRRRPASRPGPPLDRGRQPAGGGQTDVDRRHRRSVERDALVPVRDVRREAEAPGPSAPARPGPRGRRGRGRPGAGSRDRPGACRRRTGRSQSSSSLSSACAEKPLIERTWQRTRRSWPSSLTSFAPAWRWAPSVPSPW